MNYDQVFISYAITFGWAIVGGIAMAIALGLNLKIFDWFTGSINEEEELKKGNYCVAIVLAAIILATAIVVAVVVQPA